MGILWTPDPPDHKPPHGGYDLVEEVRAGAALVAVLAFGYGVLCLIGYAQ
jgi:hypothetical protein